jgi:hypothetical protein
VNRPILLRGQTRPGGHTVAVPAGAIFRPLAAAEDAIDRYHLGAPAAPCSPPANHRLIFGPPLARWRVRVHPPVAMSEHEQPQHGGGNTIQVGSGPGGSVTYLVDLPPESLPTVGKRDLELAWYAARDAAIADHWGSVRAFRFNRPDGSHTDLALADRDASCWVGAVDRSVGLATMRGLSLCLRLLALVDLLARASWARPLFRLARDGAEFHPALLRAAASQPLTQDARFDEAGFRLRLARFGTGFQLEARGGNDPQMGDHQPSGETQRSEKEPRLSGAHS